MVRSIKLQLKLKIQRKVFKLPYLISIEEQFHGAVSDSYITGSNAYDAIAICKAQKVAYPSHPADLHKNRNKSRHKFT